MSLIREIETTFFNNFYNLDSLYFFLIGLRDETKTIKKKIC